MTPGRHSGSLTPDYKDHLAVRLTWACYATSDGSPHGTQHALPNVYAHDWQAFSQ